MNPVHVTDHAVLRYLERVLDIDVERLRTMIGDACARHQGAPAVKAGGAHFLLKNGRVVSCLADKTVPHFDVLADLCGSGRGRPK